MEFSKFTSCNLFIVQVDRLLAGSPRSTGSFGRQNAVQAEHIEWRKCCSTFVEKFSQIRTVFWSACCVVRKFDLERETVLVRDVDLDVFPFCFLSWLEGENPCVLPPYLFFCLVVVANSGSKCRIFEQLYTEILVDCNVEVSTTNTCGPSMS